MDRYAFIRRNVTALAAIMLLASCTSVPSVPDGKTLKMNALMNEIADGYAEVRACLPRAQFRSIEIIDERHLLFRGRANQAWINKFQRPCHGLRRNDSLRLELRSTGACKTNVVSVNKRAQSWKHEQTCNLGEFKAIPPGYVRRIDELLRSD